MKTLKFFAVVIAAFAMLVACEGPDTPTDKPGENDTTITDSTVVKDTVETPVEEALVIKLDWGGLSDSESVNKIYEVGMSNFEGGQFVVHVWLKNATEESKTFTLKEVRHYDLTTAMPSVCTSQCMASNGKAEQIWNLGTVAPGEILNESGDKISLDLYPMTFDENNNPVAATFKSDFTFSDGTTEIGFTINYNYTPVAE